MATAQQDTSLTLYGARDEVKELGARLQNYMPSAQKFTNIEAQAVAQIALAHGLDCFNGEVWGLKNYSGEWYGVMVGVKGLRKCSNRQAKQEGTVYWKELIKVDPAKYGEPKEAIVYECIIRDTLTTQAWGQSLKTLTIEANVPYKEAIEMLGKAPSVVGVGIASPTEKSKMKIDARAQKRAEADALKKRFDVSFGEGVLTEGDKELMAIDAEAVDGEARYVTDADSQAEPAEEPAPAPKKTESQIMSELYGEPALPSADYSKASPPKSVAVPRAGAAPTTPRRTELMAQFSQTYNAAAKAKLTTPENMKAWSVSGSSTEQDIEGKIALIQAALDAANEAAQGGVTLIPD